MPIDLKYERLIRFADVPALSNLPLRRKGARLHLATIHRWRKPGVHGVCLEAVRCGGVWCTSVEALQRFFDRLACAQEHSLPATGRQVQDLVAVNRKLDEERIK
jgi:Protein of unknown function (DUF1580)